MVVAVFGIEKIVEIKMIVVKIQGGLGNQMFQYAIANVLGQKNNAKILLDIDFFQLTEKKPGFTPRKFELLIFGNNFNYATHSHIRKFERLSYLDRIKKALKLSFHQTYNEPDLNFYRQVLLLNSPLYLKGYFQSYKYLEGYEDFLQNVFKFPVDSIGNENADILERIKAITTIAIHVRRGDYVADSITNDFHGICSLDYYMTAISVISSRINDFSLVFFSDDSEWVKTQFCDLPHSKFFVDCNKNEDSWKDMFLMSNCNHNIIANSSFSWWGAWLNKNPNKIVVAPKKWFANEEVNLQTKKLMPESWMRI